VAFVLYSAHQIYRESIMQFNKVETLPEDRLT
jgi:hypothetical protein